jgi:hypothetical protein
MEMTVLLITMMDSLIIHIAKIGRPSLILSTLLFSIKKLKRLKNKKIKKCGKYVTEKEASYLVRTSFKAKSSIFLMEIQKRAKHLKRIENYLHTNNQLKIKT